MDNLDCKSLEVPEGHPSSEALLGVRRSMGVGRNLGAVDVAAIPFFEEADTLECGVGIRGVVGGIHHKLNWEDSPGAVQHLEACLQNQILDVKHQLRQFYVKTMISHPRDNNQHSSGMYVIIFDTLMIL